MSFNLDLPNSGEKALTEDEKLQLDYQNSRIVPEFKANQLEINAQRNWDLFYKRNDTRFFRDRHWTTREFEELVAESSADESNGRAKKCVLEVGCGVGNFVFPLIEDKQNTNYFIYACDFSPRAVEFVKENALYDETLIKAFQCDITNDKVFEHIDRESLDIISLIFVMSAIHPSKFQAVLDTLFALLKPGGLLLFRDYGRYDMAQIRFRPGNKIADNFYMRQDGTRSYYFSEDELADLVHGSGFEIMCNAYIHRKTINVKENIDKTRIFVQGKYKKPIK